MMLGGGLARRSVQPEDVLSDEESANDFEPGIECGGQDEAPSRYRIRKHDTDSRREQDMVQPAEQSGICSEGVRIRKSKEALACHIAF
jgi:hypothetical protein